MAEPDITDSLAKLVAEFSRSGLAELSVRSGDLEVFLSNVAGLPGLQRTSRTTRAAPVAAQPGAPSVAPVAAPAEPRVSSAPPPATTADLPPGARIVTAPNLGTFYRAPKPGAAPYVEVGQIIAEGDELCLIEVMKLFTAVRAEVSGRVHAVLTEDGVMVEAGQPLFALVDA